MGNDEDALPRDPEIVAMEQVSEVLADLHDEDPGAVGRVLRWALDRFDVIEGALMVEYREEGGDGKPASLLTESQRFQVQETRDCLGTWDLARAGVAGVDRETVLADQVRALLAIIDAVAPAAGEEIPDGG